MAEMEKIVKSGVLRKTLEDDLKAIYSAQMSKIKLLQLEENEEIFDKKLQAQPQLKTQCLIHNIKRIKSFSWRINVSLSNNYLQRVKF